MGRIRKPVLISVAAVTGIGFALYLWFLLSKRRDSGDSASDTDEEDGNDHDHVAVVTVLTERSPRVEEITKCTPDDMKNLDRVSNDTSHVERILTPLVTSTSSDGNIEIQYDQGNDNDGDNRNLFLLEDIQCNSEETIRIPIMFDDTTSSDRNTNYHHGETSDPDRVVTPLQGNNNIDYFSLLPKDIISLIISFTSPGDASRLAMLSKNFYDAANSDALWRHFLLAVLPDGIPDDFHALQTERKRYLYLCDHPVLLDEGIRSFRLDMLSGAPIYFLSARALSITWGDSPQYWRWVAHQDSRFSTVAELLNVCWFEVWAEFNSKNLLISTFYEAYFVFKTTDESYGFDNPIYEAILSVGNQESRQTVCLEASIRERYQNVRLPQARMDGWMEMMLGEFYNDEDGRVVMKLLETEKLRWKRGLIVEGIEIRPKPQEKVSSD